MVILIVLKMCIDFLHPLHYADKKAKQLLFLLFLALTQYSNPRNLILLITFTTAVKMKCLES